MASTISPPRLSSSSSSARRGDSLSYLSPSSGSDNSFVTPPMSPTPSTPPPAGAGAGAAGPGSSPLNAVVSAAGIATTPKGERLIPASTRKDGSVRKEIRIRPGFVPTEDVPRYNVAERVHARRQRLLAREKGFEEGQQDMASVEAVDVDKDVNDASNVLESLFIDADRGPPATVAGTKTGSGEQGSRDAQVGRPAITPGPPATASERIAPTRQPKNAPSDRSGGWSRSNSTDSTTSGEVKDNCCKSAAATTTTTPRAGQECKTTKPVDNNGRPVESESTATVPTTFAVTESSGTVSIGWDAPTSSSTTNAASGWDLPKSSDNAGGWGCVTSESEWTPLESGTSTFTATDDSVFTNFTEAPGRPDDRAEGLHRGRSRWKDDNAGLSPQNSTLTGGMPVDNTPDWRSRVRVPGRQHHSGRDGDYSSPGGPVSHMMWTDPPSDTSDKGPRRVNSDRRGQSPEERKRALEEFLNRPLEMKHNYPSFNEFVGARGSGRTNPRAGPWTPSSENDKAPTEVSGQSAGGKVLASRYAH
ncbi:hypothetical protein V1509DRAFT_613730 [Lipomyces kononenkoae]